jgi:hypothetical protein
MSDFTRVDWQALKAARGKMRTVIIQLEEGQRPHNDILHPAYKLSQFLSEALPDAWPAVELEIPGGPPAPSGEEKHT